jgi:hypothetical protein
MKFRRITVIDTIDHLKDLLDTCIVAHENIANKSKIMLVLMEYVQPELENIKEMVMLLDDSGSQEEDEEEDD